MLNRVTKWHHLAVGLAVALTPALVALGLMGRGMYPERFDAKQVMVTPGPGRGVTIREVVDEDFGGRDRHGYQRIIPNDFGVPTNITASSPDASARVTVDDMGDGTTRIRLGDPKRTTYGQHRYVLTYTLPNANIGSAPFALDIIGTDETQETGRFDVILNGFQLRTTRCDVGSRGTSGGCTFTGSGALFTATISPLRPGQGITVGGDLTGTTAPIDVTVPPLPARRSSHTVPLAAGTAALGIMVAAGTFVLAERRGRNQVGGSAAADAAYATATGPTRLVTDKELEAMATTEFEPPRGLRPWHGALLLRERIDDTTVSAWFSDQIAQGVIELRDNGKEIVPGPHLAEAPPTTKARVDSLLAGQPSLALGKYEPRLRTIWTDITKEQKVAARESGWWTRGAPGSGSSIAVSLVGVLFVAMVFFGFSLWNTFREAIAVTLLTALVAPMAVAAVAYASFLPSRSATGSAVALRAESFRRFLQASEGKHVDWAWQHNLLREYSAWAVALGAAEAWGRAVAASAVPPPDIAMSTMPLLMHTNAAAWHSSFTPPSKSGGGGGFGGGGVGGGGGGGSSGSW